MKMLHLTAQGLATGENALATLSSLSFQRAFLVTGGKSMFQTGVIDRITEQLSGGEVSIFGGIGKNPTKSAVEAGLAQMREFTPDLIIAVGGGSAIDAAKAMVLFYEYPNLNFENVTTVPLPQRRHKTTFVAIPSTSGTATEVTHVSVITYPELAYKVAIKTEAIRPDLAILDPSLPLTLPPHIAAETGMDALTHALESFVNRTKDDFTDALAYGAIQGLLEWLPRSCAKPELTSREKVHYYQCMAGMSFSNSGLGMVHGISHAFGGKYNLAHGLCNAVILPYSMQYNKKDPWVRQQYNRLLDPDRGEIIPRVFSLGRSLGIPTCIRDAGVSEEDFCRDFSFLLKNAMKGSTPANPIPVSEEDMAKILHCVFYGVDITF